VLHLPQGRHLTACRVVVWAANRRKCGRTTVFNGSDREK
jgi:hypothetical protein